LKNKIEKLISCVLLAASFLKSKTKAMGHSVLTAASFCRHSEKKSLIYGALAASVVVLGTLFFSLTYSYFFSGSGHHEPESKVLSTPAYAKNNKALTASVDKQDVVVVSTDKESNVQAIREQAALLLTKDTDQAERLLQKAVKADPQNAMTYHDLGKLYSQKKDHLNAINAYKKAADLNSDSANTFFNLGFTYAAIKDYVHAEQMFLRVIELEPPYFDKAMVNLALVQYKQGKKQQCIENLGNALKINPDNEKAHKCLKQFAAVSGE
jgi:tetratricopeptide (TPR) repeat protein